MPTRPDHENVTNSFSNLADIWEKENLNSIKYTGIPLEDVSVAKNVIIASRPKLFAYLINCIALDVNISNFDIDPSHGLIAICSGRVVYLFDLSTFDLIQKFGRADGGAHKGNVRDISIDPSAKYIASCGEDRRIAVWNIKTGVSEKTFEAHDGVIYQIEFSKDAEQVISCSEDGRVIIWDWATGSPLMSFMKHPAAVRGFDFNFDTPEQIYCARADGYTTIWNLDYLLRMDNIVPDDEWLDNAVDESRIGWENVRKMHTGSINCVKIAPNGWLLATGSNDRTCKVWNIVSHKKEISYVQTELNKEEESLKNMNAYINISDPMYDIQADQPDDRQALKVGEAELATGYHSDLILTLRHDGPVMSVCFSANSVLIATGSADSTCRLWSSWRGDLLFQINTPSPVDTIFLGNGTNLYASCQNRLLVFDYRIKIRENTVQHLKPLPDKVYANAQGEVSENTALADLQAAVTVGQKVVPVFSSAQPDVPHRPKKVTKVYETIKEDPEEFEEEEMPGDSGTGVVPAGEPKSYELSVSSQRPRMTRKKSVAIQPQQESSSFAGAVSRVAAEITAHDINGHQRHSVVEQAAIVQDITREVSYRPAEPDYRPVTLDELKKLSSHGLLKPRAFHSIIQNIPDLDMEQLKKNMTKFNIHPQQILRVLINNSFAARDLLGALSRKANDVSVLYSMLSRNNPIAGYMARLGLQPISALDKAKDKFAVFLKRNDLENPAKGSVVVSWSGDSFEYATWFKSYWSEPKPSDYDPSTENPAFRYERENEDEEESDEFDEDDDMYEDGEEVIDTSRGSLLHFVPSMQMKLLKDLRSKRKIRPIFLRQLISESESGTRYPNFHPEDESRDAKPLVMKVRQLQRFNEPLSDNNNRRRRSTFTGAKVPQAQQAQRVEDNDIMSPNEVTVNMGLQMGKKRMTITLDKLSATTSMSGPSGMNGSSSFGTGEQRSSQFMPPGGAGHRLSLRSPIKLSDLAKDPTGQAFRSSKVFQPEKYLKTRGISVSFEGGEDRSSPNGEVKTIRTNVRQSSLMDGHGGQHSVEYILDQFTTQKEHHIPEE